jgi:glycosyltransferase involved in cell wall biosynthesis
MRVLFISHYSSLHGANLSLLELILGLRKKYNIDPVVLIPSNGRITDFLKDNDIEYVIIKFRPWKWRWHKYRIINSLKNYLLQKLSLRKLATHFKNANIDIIHTNSSVTPIGVFLSKSLQAKHVWHIREFGEPDFGLKDVYSKRYNNNWIDRSQGIIYISKAVKDHFRSKYDFKYPKEYIIYNGINYEKFENESLIDNDGVFKFVCCAYNSKGKNQLELLKATNFLKDRTSKLFEVILVGGFSKEEGYRSELLQYVHENDLNSHVTILDYVENISSIYKKSNVGILCSISEGFGRVVAEYMYFKMPVIVANSGALPELVDHEVNGFIYELGNVDALSSFMLHTINHPDQVSKMGAKGKNKAIENFELNRVIDEVYKVYKAILTN